MQEREHERDHGPETLRRDSADRTAPGRTSASASLVRSGRPTTSGLLMRKASGSDVADDAAESVDRAANSNSQALPDDLKERFEGSLGTDLSSVRVHTGAESATAAQAVGARAYTVGSDIHFGANEYDPGSTSGQQLIAHEVAHTVQQRGGAATRQHKLAVSQAGDALEGEADRAADAMVAGAPATVSGGGVGMVARKEAAAPSKPGAGKPEPKRDSDKASVPDQSVDIKLFGRSGAIKCTEAGVSGNLALTKLPPAETSLFKMEKQWPFQLMPGGGVIIGVKGEIKATAAASITASGGVKDFGGPREETRGYEGTITGKGSMGITATGRIELLGYFGAAFANINAGGYAELSASVNTSLSGAGSFEAYPGGELGGSASAEFGTDVTVKASGGFTIGWEALVASGKFYEVEIKSGDVLTGKLGKKSVYDFATGASSTTETSEALKWMPINLSEPKVLKSKVATAAKTAAKNVLDNEKNKNGNDIEGQQCVPRDEDKKTSTEATDCDPENASCEE